MTQNVCVCVDARVDLQRAVLIASLSITFDPHRADGVAGGGDRVRLEHYGRDPVGLGDDVDQGFLHQILGHDGLGHPRPDNPSDDRDQRLDDTVGDCGRTWVVIDTDNGPHIGHPTSGSFWNGSTAAATQPRPKGVAGYTPLFASIRPELTASVKAW